MIDNVIRRIAEGVEYNKEKTILGYLALLDMRNSVQQNEEMGKEGEFYIKHRDDDGMHIMVDEDGHITAIIDLEW